MSFRFTLTTGFSPRPRGQLASISALLAAVSLTACDGPTSSDVAALPSSPLSPTAPGAPSSVARNHTTDVMLYNGSGAWQTEVTSLQSIFKAHGLSYTLVNESDLNSMTLEELTQFGLLLFPGGAGGTMGSVTSSATHARLREAVQIRGVSYLGFCAGSFVAAAPAPASGKDVSYGFGVIDAPVMDYYSLENTTDFAMTMETFADGTKRDLVWYGGPVTPNVAGGVIAKYPDGTPAITQMRSGNGFVIVSGPHPAAPQNVRDSFGVTDSDGLDLDIAFNLIDSALHARPMAAF